MKRRVLFNLLSVFAITLAAISPAVAADTNISEPEAPQSIANIIISEVQTNGEGTGTSGQEFIELYNHSEQIVNILNYKLAYVTSTGTESDLFIFNEPLMFLPNTFLLGKLSDTAGSFLPEITADFEYNKGASGIAASAGGLRLFNDEDVIIDEIFWTSAASSETPSVTFLVGGKSAQRYYLDDALVTNEMAEFIEEFIVDEPTPAEMLYKVSPPPEEEPPQDAEEQIAQSEPLNNPPIYLNELFIDPVSPQLDSVDEFVEIYNPNNQKIDISDYIITAGTTTKYKHTIPKGSFINPNSFLIIKASESNLTLANSAGAVTLTDNLNRQIDSAVYSDAEPGASWAKSGSQWLWTTTVTPGQANIIQEPIKIVKASTVATKTSSTAKTSSTKSTKTNFTNAPPIKINEIFPDPSSPQKDSEDEFIELYNPHDFAINIADYTITSGATRIYRHTIKAPATIAAKGFYTVTSGNTSLSLPNSGGKVTLINNFDKQIDSVEYPDSKPGSSWAIIDGKWQWTASPTKNTSNKASGLIEGLNSNKQDSLTKVSSAVVSGTDDTPLIAAPQPLPGWVLAVLGVSAVCYAAYEYRFEARNYYYRYQRIRSSR